MHSVKKICNWIPQEQFYNRNDYTILHMLICIPKSPARCKFRQLIQKDRPLYKKLY